MADGSEVRAWGELIPKVLGLIFRNLPLREILTVIPRVSKSWGRAVLGPYCWQEIDIDQWSRRCDPEQLDQILRMLIERSYGSFRRLSVFGLRTESMFTFIADHAGSLERLELPKSEISDSIVELVAPRLSSLTYLDLSFCTKIGARAIEAFGKHCRSLVVFCRRTQPFEDYDCQEEEAFAVAKMMTKLRHLEMPHQLATTRGVLEILCKCKDLKYLDIRGCRRVKLDEKYLKEWHSGVKVEGPTILNLNYAFTYDVGVSEQRPKILNFSDMFSDDKGLSELGSKILNSSDVFTDDESLSEQGPKILNLSDDEAPSEQGPKILNLSDDEGLSEQGPKILNLSDVFTDDEGPSEQGPKILNLSDDKGLSEQGSKILNLSDVFTNDAGPSKQGPKILSLSDDEGPSEQGPKILNLSDDEGLWEQRPKILNLSVVFTDDESPSEQGPQILNLSDDEGLSEQGPKFLNLCNVFTDDEGHSEQGSKILNVSDDEALWEQGPKILNLIDVFTDDECTGI